MKIAKYIADLLFEYECIVVPGFGGLITKEIPAQIHPIQNHFIPPSKEIVFNVHLKTNDGLLVNHIARQENLTYIEARSAVERFVKKCMIELNNGKQIRFRKVGVIFMDNKKNILFEPDKTQNYLADSFGLKSFVSPPIKRTIIRPTTKSNKTSKTIIKDRTPKETAKRQQKPKVQGPKYININVSFVIIVLAVAALFYYKPTTVKKYYNSYASAIPFFYSSPNEYIAQNLDEKPMLSVLTLVDKLSAPAANQKTKKITTIKTKPEIKTPETEIPVADEKPKQEGVQKQDSVIKEEETEKAKDVIKPKGMPQTAANNNKDVELKYFIIAGVFKEKANAENMTNNLKIKGFNAMIVDQNTRGLYRVCFDAFSNINEANKQLAIIREDEESAAWVLSI